MTTFSVIELSEMTCLTKEVIIEARLYAIMLHLGHVP